MSHSYIAAIDGFGDAFALRVRPVSCPQPRQGEIAVQVEAAAVNPIDVRRRGGYGSRLFSLMGAARMPLVLGNDFVGTVCAVGQGVTGLREGDAVFGAKPPSSAGTHATHVTMRADHARLRPSSIPAAALATLPYNFLTVTRAFADAGICRETVNRRPVLVHGATGGLGQIAVWLLHRLGASVTAVGGAKGLDACLAAGAAEVVDRHRQRLASLPRHFAATVNFANWGDEADLLHLLAPDAVGHATTVHPLLGNFDRLGLLGGVMATLVGKRGKRALTPKGARYGWTTFRPNPSALQALADCAAALAPPAVKTFTLSQTEQAYLHVMQGQPRRAVLLPGQL
ncbi:alcohol dehydrogenase catalytic domain-containing protein [Cupriavidus oxalaticus]|uniref:Zinc-binding alcohol dehydrogenase n=1 Tax=Cupriavidus oxalaticus TaxID=96344 RepID=A0A4P7LH71_9BURK|nr:alcohol dehydrogenase catalytic domain-containing protein [Cupriavidus oxalaticus]QBY55486.1 zinc-binding alcohol dehydrogenase [Cupriavidus oxalaticus]